MPTHADDPQRHRQPPGQPTAIFTRGRPRAQAPHRDPAVSHATAGTRNDDVRTAAPSTASATPRAGITACRRGARWWSSRSPIWPTPGRCAAGAGCCTASRRSSGPQARSSASVAGCTESPHDTSITDTFSQVGLEQVESRSPRPPAASTSRSRWACFSRKRRLSLSPVGIRDSVARRSSISVPMCCRRGAQADQCGRGDLLQPPTTGNTGHLASQVEWGVDAPPAQQSAPVALGSYLPHSSGKAARPPSTLAAETA